MAASGNRPETPGAIRAVPAEALKHERYLYLAHAGQYAGEDRHDLLAERLEGLISQEHAKWTASQKSSDQHQQSQ